MIFAQNYKFSKFFKNSIFFRILGFGNPDFYKSRAKNVKTKTARFNEVSFVFKESQSKRPMDTLWQLYLRLYKLNQ